MERNLDDEIPDGLSEEDNDSDEEEDDDEEDDFDNQPDLDNEIPTADEGASYGGVMVRDLDEAVPEAGDDDDDSSEDEDMDEGEWQHTDSEDDEDDDDDNTNDPFAEHFRTASNNTTAVTPQPTNSAVRRRAIPLPPQQPPTRPRETEAQRRFLQRWSGGGGADAFESSMLTDEDDLRASITSQDSVRRQSRFGRFARRGGPRDSLD
jgi:hypothetical protein